MAIIAVEEAKAVLEPHVSPFIECWKAAWEKWLRIGEAVPDGQVAIRARAQANVIYDLMVYQLKHRFTGVPDVAISEKGGFLTLNFGDVILLRFKKVDQNLRSHNIMTQQQKLFNLQLVLPGFPDAPTRVVLGYQLDKLRMNLQNFVVTCSVGDELQWYLPLMQPPAQNAHVLPLPVEPDMPKPRVSKKRKQDEGQADQDTRETGAQ